MSPHEDEHREGRARVEAALEQLRLGNGVIVFDDGGELLPDSRATAPKPQHVAAPTPLAA